MGTPGMAAANSLCAHPTTLQRAPFPDGFNGILRAGGGMPAVAAQQGRNCQLVEAYR